MTEESRSEMPTYGFTSCDVVTQRTFTSIGDNFVTCTSKCRESSGEVVLAEPAVQTDYSQTNFLFSGWQQIYHCDAIGRPKVVENGQRNYLKRRVCLVYAREYNLSFPENPETVVYTSKKPATE